MDRSEIKEITYIGGCGERYLYWSIINEEIN